MLIVQDEIGFGTYTKAAFYSEPSALTASKDSDLLNSSEWSPWGCNNDEPSFIANDIENCGVLSSAVEAEARLAVGNCIDAFLLVDKKSDGTETLDWVSDSEVQDFFEANQAFEYSYRNIYNMVGYGWAATQFLLNAKRDKINRIHAIDVYEARLAKRDKKSGLMSSLFMCNDWQNPPSKFDNDKISRIALLEEGWELEQLKTLNKGYEFALLHRILKNGRKYYPKPLHRSAKAWIAISRSVPAIKAAINKNQMTIKYMVVISETYWTRVHKKWNSYTPKERQDAMDKKYREINDWLTGEINSGKSIIAGSYYDPLAKSYVDDIRITVIDDKFKDGKMLPDSAAADKQILFSMFFNPAIWGGNLLGDGASGGAGSGSDIREATLVLLNLLNPERQNNLKIFNLVKNFNGWSKRLEVERTIFPVTNISNTNIEGRKIKPRLVFRYSSAVLTTLDQGKSQQPITN